jgi:hypothetical protein
VSFLFFFWADFFGGVVFQSFVSLSSGVFSAKGALSQKTEDVFFPSRENAKTPSRANITNKKNDTTKYIKKQNPATP